MTNETEAAPSSEKKEKASSKTLPVFGAPKKGKFTGARQSKENPRIQSMVQHEQNKMRIAKIFVGITVAMAVLLVVYLVMDSNQKTTARSALIAGEIDKLDDLDRKIAESDYYTSARCARDGVRIAENVIKINYANLDKRRNVITRLAESVVGTENRNISDEMDKRIAKYNEILETSFPILAAEGYKGANFIVKSAMLDMIHIPDGEFSMGRGPDETGEKDELPRRTITIQDQFWIARTPVDVWQMRKLIPGYNILIPGQRTGEYAGFQLDHLNFPAGNVKWHTAVLYCQTLTRLEQEKGRVPEGYEYRLPTEAEWEYACRAGTDTIYYWGNGFGNEGAKYANSLDKQAAMHFDWKGGPDMADKDGFIVASPCGNFKPNNFGLFDMSGNVWEWCFDWYYPQAYDEKITRTISPVQLHSFAVSYQKMLPFDAGVYYIEIPCKVIRGGSWGSLPSDLRSALRSYRPPDDENIGVGFRPVLAPKIETKTRL